MSQNKPLFADNRFSIGVNYWASHASIHMWTEWDADKVEQDFQKLSSCGIDTLRVFLLWPAFQPLKAMYANLEVYEYRMQPGEQPLPDTPAGRAGVSETACEHFSEFCDLAERYHLKLIVGLLTGHMSMRFFSPEAFEGKNFLSDPTVIKWETRFVRYFVSRFKDSPAIAAWDLGNECGCEREDLDNPDQAYVWATAITAAIRESDSCHPVVSGFDFTGLDREPFNIREFSELVDINTTHPYQIFSSTSIDPIDTVRPIIDPAMRATLYEDLGQKPAFVEEVGSIGYMNNSEKTEDAFYRALLFSTWAQGCHSCCWWCAFDQGSFDYAPYDWNNYGSEYGFFREDGSEKPIAHTARGFRDFLNSFPYADLPKHTVEAVCVVPRLLEEPLKVLNSTFLLAKQANLDLRFAHAEEALPDAPLYIMPSVANGKPIFLHRLNQLLEKVRGGASLYFSMGDTLARRIPELTGLTIASRNRAASQTIEMDGKFYRFGESVHYNIESVSTTCTVLARGADGQPVYVCNRYGKGKIYFLALPLEDILGSMPAAFTGPDVPDYARFYEAFAGEADGSRAAKSKNRSIFLTEHVIDDASRVIVAINYDNRDAGLDLQLKDGWSIRSFCRGSALIPANDAAVFLVEKK